MEYIKFCKNNGYDLVETSQTKIEHLAYFLCSDYASGWQSLKKDIKEIQHFEIEANQCWLEKWNNNILIGNLFHPEFETNKYASFFSLYKDQFLYLLDKWDELYKLQPNEIIITYENGIISIEGKD